jgi:hypothetical protein
VEKWRNSRQRIQRGGQDLVRGTKIEPPLNYAKFIKRVFPSVFLWIFLSFILLYILKTFMPEQEIIDIKALTSGPWEAFFSVFGILYAVIIGMLVVEALNHYNNLRSTIEQEINAVQDIRDFLIYLEHDDQARPAIRQSLSSYVKSVMTRDWPKMRSKTDRDRPRSSDSYTCRELYQLMKDIRTIKTNNEGASKIAMELMMNKVSEITTYRTDRFMSAVDHLTFPMRVLLQVFSATIIIFLILMLLEPTWLHCLMVWGYGSSNGCSFRDNFRP